MLGRDVRATARLIAVSVGSAVVLLLTACAPAVPGSGAPAPGTGGGTLATQQPAGPSNKQADAVLVMAVNASCTGPPSADSAGQLTSFDPVLALDGDPATAWRCPGDGRDQRISLDFGRPVRITAIAVIPGYAKTDVKDGTDRYRQNRRLTEVLYALDGQSAFAHTLNPSPDLRASQVLNTGGVVSQGLTVNLISSAPGEPTNGQPAADNVAISELVVLGTPQ